MLLSAKQHYDRGRFADASQKTSAFLASYEDRPESAEALYLRALARIRQKQRTPAYADLNQALARSKRDDLTTNIHTQLAHLQYDDKNWEAAVGHFEHAVKKQNDGPLLDKVLFRYAVALQSIGHWAEARIQFGKIVHFYRNSPLREKARKKAAWSNRFFTIQTGAFSQRGLAERETRSLREQGFDGFRSSDLPGGRMWKVYVGQYAIYDDAARALDRVRQDRSDAYIVP